jgi:hypothetical protein
MSNKYINDPSQLDSLQYQYWSGPGASEQKFNTGNSINFQLDGKEFTFIPTDVINKGFTDGNTQYYFSDLLKKGNLDTLKTKGQTVDLNGVSWYGDFLKDTMGRNTTGVLIPTEEANKVMGTLKSYEIGSTYGKKNNIPKTAITGLAQTKKGDFVYQNEIPEGKYPVGGTKWAYNYIDGDGTIRSGAKAAPKSSGGLLGKVAKVVDKVAPVALAFVPGIGPALSAAYSTGSVIGKGGSIEDAFKAGAISYGASTLGAKVGGQLGGAESTTDFLGSQALGDATTGAVGSGSTGFGINAGANIGVNAGAGAGAIGLDASGNLIGNPTSQVFDDGSTLISDSSGKPISGTDSANKPFTVIDGVGKYDDGTLLGGTPEKTFGGQLADKEDVDKLLKYNAATATATDGLSEAEKAKKLADALTTEQPKSNFDPYMLVKGLNQGQQNMPIGYNMNQNPFTFTQQLPIQGNAGQMTATPLDVTDQKRNMAALLRNL